MCSWNVAKHFPTHYLIMLLLLLLSIQTKGKQLTHYKYCEKEEKDANSGKLPKIDNSTSCM
jgi:hypothetical protein